MIENVAPIWQGQVGRQSGRPKGEPGDIAELFLAARRQFWLIAFFASLGLALGAFHYVTSPRLFYSSATVLIEERQSDLDQEISSLRPLTRNETGFENQMQILRSTHLAGEVVRRLGLEENAEFLATPRSALSDLKSRATAWLVSKLPQAETASGGEVGTPEAIAEARIRKAAARLARETMFFRIGKSYSVEIGFLSHDPALAAAIANAYGEAYLDDGRVANLTANDRTATWMRERLEGLRQGAVDAAAEAESFRAEHGAMDQQGLREREQRAEALNALYLTLEAQYQETLLASSFPVANGRILSEALVAERALEPRAWRILAAGLILGAMAGLALAVMRELRETGFRTAGDLRKAGLGFLGYLPVISARDLRAVRLSRAAATPRAAHTNFASSRSPHMVSRGSPAIAPLLLREPVAVGQVTPELMISVQAETTPFQLAMRNILASIDLGLDDNRGRVIAVGGLAGGEGATTLAANLANLAALTGRKTLLIDGDLARRDLTGRLGLDGTEASGAPYDGPEQLSRTVQTLPGSGLDVLPSPASDGSGSETSRIAGFRLELASAKSRYDLVFVDLPPLGHRPEAKSWLRALDGIVLVVGWGRTSRGMLQTYLDREPELQKRVLGAVLNRTVSRRLGRYGVPVLDRPATV